MATQLLQGSRRLFMMGAAVLAAAGVTRRSAIDALAQDAEDGRTRSRAEALELLEGYGFLWSATSPAIRLDDEAALLFTNRGSGSLDIWAHTIVMDHQAHHNEVVIDEMFTLAAGESRTLFAVNTYGQANHFSTRIAAGTGDPLELGVEVTITDGSGAETASFNELAFWIKSYDEVLANIEARRLEGIEPDDHAGR